MVRIPSEYQEVEYIESTGTQYIVSDINVPWNENQYKVLLDSEVIELRSGSTNIICGCSDGGDAGTWFGVTTNEKLTVGGGNNFAISPYERVSSKIIFGSYEMVATVDNETVQRRRLGKANDKIAFFATGSGQYSSIVKIYSAQIIWNDSLVANFIPCYRKSDNEIGMYDTVSKQFYTNSGTGTFLKGNDVTYDNINLLESRRRILLNTPHIETVSDTVASFKTDVPANLKECKIHFTPIQEGEGDPSPENIRPIHGWDGVTVTACGKNLFDFSAIKWTNGYYLGNITSCDGKAKSAGSYMVSEFVPCPYLANQTVTIGFMANAGAQNYASCCFYTDANEDSYIEDAFITYGRRATGLTVPSNAKYIRFSMLRLASTKSQWFGLKSQIDSYEPYTATTITIPFPQTIYGGYVDLVKGEVVEEWEDITLDSLNWNLSTTTKRARYTYGYLYITPESTVVPQAIAEKYKAVPANYYVTNKTFAMTKSGTFVFYYEDKIPTGKLCAKLSTPSTYPIDPQTLKALRGMNNIWSDANGNIEVSYYTH